MIALTPPPPLTLRPLRPEDIERVVEIEQVAKTSPWSAKSYAAELNNENSSPVVVEIAPEIVGYTVSWLIAGEIQINTIATAPAWRGRGLGELLLLNSLLAGVEKEAHTATLEVRRSNLVAQRLYHKYGFFVMGIRPRYYRDNGEDAFLMTAGPFKPTYRRELLHRWELLQERFKSAGFTPKSL